MKPLYLEFCGINSFSEPARIDFRELLEFGIFGIFGDTGSGKSTVLDAIGFALYGGVSRSRTGSVADIVNYKADKAYAVLEFEIVFEGRRRVFRAERELKRKNAAQSARVYERSGETLTAVTEGVRESNAFLERVVGLEQKDFEKCIALPQGEFAQFVRAQRGDRLKLVSRLFDLEAYGERLVKRVNARAAEAGEQTRIAAARLEPFAEASEERLAEAEARRNALRGEEDAVKAELKASREEENALTALAGVAKEKKALEAKREALAARRDGFDTLESELDRLSHAAAVAAAMREGKERAERIARAEAAYADAEARARGAREALDRLSQRDEEAADAEIERLASLRERIRVEEQEAAREREARERLAAVEREFAAEAALYRQFSYEARRAEIEARLEVLGDGDFVSFAEEHGRAALLRTAYAEFVAELRALAEKYPEAEEDIEAVARRYARLSEGEKTDLSAIRGAFAERERQREEERGKLLALEKAKGQNDGRRTRLQQLDAERGKLKKQLEERACRTVTMTLSEADAALGRLRGEKKRAAEERERANAAKTAAEAELAAATASLEAEKEALSAAKSRYRDALAAGGFSGGEEAAALAAKYGDDRAARERLKAYRAECAAADARYAELAGTDVSRATEEAMRAAKERRAAAEERARAHAGELARAEDACERERAALARKRELEAVHAAAKTVSERLERLKKLLEGNKFMEFVAEEYLQTVAFNASGRLLSLTDGRYFLRYEGGFFVGDNFNGGALRGVHTLSGGETFLVSLSLALALGAEICARSARPIEFFFLDEGFGTLDGHLVDTVVDSLEKLKSENFSIGVISHVEELKHRIDRKLTVKKATERHGSQIQAE